MEFLFRHSRDTLRILTRRLSADVYGVPEVVEAAVGFLRRNRDASIQILAEWGVDRATNPLLQRLDAEGFTEQVSLRFVRPSVRDKYKFNFSVGDEQSYRYEEFRDRREALVQFGGEAFASGLVRTFDSLANTTTDAYVESAGVASAT